MFLKAAECTGDSKLFLQIKRGDNTHPDNQ